MSWDNHASHYETPMETGSPVRPSNFGYNSFHTPYKIDQSLSQFNMNQKQFDNRYLSAHAVEQQLALILKQPSITQKCTEIGNFIKERFACNMSRSVMSQFKPIVENIFGHDSTALSNDHFASGSYSCYKENRPESQFNWMLRTLTRTSNPSDYDSVVSFLHPDGLFFALIKSLMTETSAKFEFPVTQFPTCFRAMIENGTAPPFFVNKIISTSYGSASHLILNPFEFYIFHFGLYILNNSGSTFDTSNPINEPAYFTLLKIYMNYFVPIENVPRLGEGPNFLCPSGNSNQPGSLWQSLSSTTTSILNLATNSNQTNTTNQANTNNGGHILPSLFKASIFQPQTPFNQNVTTNHLSTPGPMLYGQGEHLGSIEWRCSTFLLMLTELWFGNIPISNIQPYSANIDQMTSVRIVIKHLHNFSNSFTYNPVGHANNQGLAEIKQAVWTSKYPLQRRLYTFIKVAFNRWPMDYNFRQPLEAWLSYIQPWRYVKMNSDQNNDFDELDGNRSACLIDVLNNDNHWRNFISDNLLYYTVIFNLLINRLLRLDLSSSRNALMLYRVIKVYSQPGFLLLLRDAEEAVMRNNLEYSMNISTKKSPHKNTTITTPAKSSEAKLLAPSFLASGRVSTPKTRIGALEHHLINLESDSEFDYVSLFSPQMKQHLIKLLVAVQKSRLSIKEFHQSLEMRTKLRSRGWIESIRAFLTMEDTCFESKDEREMYKDKMQAEEYLSFATNKISLCFELQVPEIDLQMRSVANLTTSQSSRIFFN